MQYVCTHWKQRFSLWKPRTHREVCKTSIRFFFLENIGDICNEAFHGSKINGHVRLKAISWKKPYYWKSICLPWVCPDDLGEIKSIIVGLVTLLVLCVHFTEWLGRVAADSTPCPCWASLRTYTVGYFSLGCFTTLGRERKSLISLWFLNAVFAPQMEFESW